jgi:hypothetical protein
MREEGPMVVSPDAPSLVPADTMVEIPLSESALKRVCRRLPEGYDINDFSHIRYMAAFSASSVLKNYELRPNSPAATFKKTLFKIIDCESDLFRVRTVVSRDNQQHLQEHAASDEEFKSGITWAALGPAQYSHLSIGVCC